MNNIEGIRLWQLYRRWCSCFFIFVFIWMFPYTSIANAETDEAVEVEPESQVMVCSNVIHLEAYDLYDDEVVVLGNAELSPRDSVFANRQMLMNVLNQSVLDVADATGVEILPEYLLGIIIKETGGTHFCELMDEKDWLHDLVMGERACEKSNCYYNKLGMSHFVGGQVVNGKDMGDPYTMEIDTSWSSYRRAIQAAEANGVTGGHALGFIQFEIPYIANRMTHTFPEDTLGVVTLDFVRPNFFYIPDQIYAMAFFTAYCGMADDIYWDVLSDPEYLALDERNQAFIRLVMQNTAYACGYLLKSNKTVLHELVQLKESGAIEYFDEMLLPFKDEFFDPETKLLCNYDPWGCREYINKTYGIQAGGMESLTWSGIYSACAGRAAWVGMQEAIETDARQARIESLQLNTFQQAELKIAT